MKTLILSALLCLAIPGCANGPTHDYYNPEIVGAHYRGHVTIEQTKDMDAIIELRLAEGYTIIGSTRYSGKYPETVELVAQARRVGANHVVYSSRYIPPQPGSWHFNMWGNGAAGGTDGGRSDNYIVFMGK